MTLIEKATQAVAAGDPDLLTRDLFCELLLALAEAHEALAAIHQVTGRGDGHGTPRATAECCVNAFVTASIDHGEAILELKTKVKDLELRDRVERGEHLFEGWSFSRKARKKMWTRRGYRVYELPSGNRYRALTDSGDRLGDFDYAMEAIDRVEISLEAHP